MHEEGFQVPQNPSTLISRYLENYKEKWRGDDLQDKDADIIHVSWCLPPKGWIKLNVDGAFTKNGVAGCGGILRGEKGEWLRGFSLKVGEQSPIATEFRAIIEGLKVCWLHGFTNQMPEKS